MLCHFWKRFQSISFGANGGKKKSDGSKAYEYVQGSWRKLYFRGFQTVPKLYAKMGMKFVLFAVKQKKYYIYSTYTALLSSMCIKNHCMVMCSCFRPKIWVKPPTVEICNLEMHLAIKSIFHCSSITCKRLVLKDLRGSQTGFSIEQFSHHICQRKPAKPTKWIKWTFCWSGYWFINEKHLSSKSIGDLSLITDSPLKRLL